VIIHGSTIIEATLHNDCKKPQQEVPHHLTWLSFLHTLIIALVAISINQSTIGGVKKAALKWKRKTTTHSHCPQQKNPNFPYP